MRKLIVLLAILLGLLTAINESRASGLVPGDVGINLRFNLRWGPNSPSGVLGPWYQYWPYEAHFITPAHPQYPNWPSPQTLHGGAAHIKAPDPIAVPAYWK